MGTMHSLSMISISLPPGTTYTMEVPATLSNGKGFWPRKDSVALEDGSTKALQRGFYVENEEVGKIVKAHKDKVAIDYQHIYPADNVVWFYSLTGEVVKISVMGSMEIHDHATISTGGPAYGTYYSQPLGGNTNG